ncbi:MAG: MoaD/ThiS family protein [Methanotrichaceae archaeon]|nr:MoaD/ThiS family protein [Methanotrichaceae archaeon]
MKITLPNGSKKELHIPESIIEDILNDLAINPVEVIVAKNSKIVSELESVRDEDEIKIIKIIHGG